MASEAEQALRAVVEGGSDADIFNMLEDWVGAVRRGEDVPAKAACHTLLHGLLTGGTAATRDSASRVFTALSANKAARAVILTPDTLNLAESTPLPSREVLAQCIAKEAASLQANSQPMPGHLVKAFAQILQDPDTGVSETGVACLAQLVATASGRALLTQVQIGDDSVMCLLTNLVKRKDSVSIRVLEALMKGGTADAEGFAFMQETGVMDLLVDGVEEATSDILLLLNYLEVLEMLAQSPHGAPFLATRKALGGRLRRLAEQNMVESVSGFALRFIGNFAAHSSDNATFALVNEWIDTAKSFCNVQDAGSLSLRGFQALGALGTTEAGLRHLMTSSDWKLLVNAAMSRQPEVAESGLHALAGVLQSTQASPLVPELLSVVQGASQDALPCLLALRSHGVLGVRVGALRLIAGLALHREAVPLLTSSQPLWDWFVDPDVESDPMCKDVKYGAAQQLAKHAEHIGRTAEEVMELRVLAKMGPLYTKRAQVAPETELDG